MQIIYTCPQCGNNLEELVLTSMPPQYLKRCNKCGWSHTEKSNSEIVRIPYTIQPEYLQNFNSALPECCKNCSNRPKNGEITSCNCALPVITRPVQKSDSNDDIVITIADSTGTVSATATKVTTSTEYTVTT